MKTSQFCIVIPIYKEELNCVEKLSLKRLVKIIEGKNYPVYLVKPESLDCTNYHNIIDKRIKVEEIYFDDKYFESIQSYSQLCLSYKFYDKFSRYEYMYIYQLDCYLFEDHLKEWCDKGYDYIGAPILSLDAGWDVYDKKKNIWEPKVGNGGFSLRKIQTFKDITYPNGEFRTYYKITDELINKVIYEDKYFCNDIIDFYEINIPNWQEACRFSFDMNADLYKEIMKEDFLPMCAHAWDRNIRHWMSRIEDITAEIVDFCEDKYKEFFKVYYNKNNQSIKENKEE